LTTPFLSHWRTQGTTAVIQNDGKILAAGYSYDHFCLARYNIDGTPDNSFDNDGKLTIHSGSTSSYTSVVSPAPLAIKADGKILAAILYNDGFSLLRFNADGSFDYSFGNNGMVVTDITSRKDQPTCMAVHENTGKILVAGYSHMQAQEDFAIVCYNADGSLNNGFDGDGKMNAHFGTSYDLATALAVQNDGKLIVGGYGGRIEVGHDNDLVLMRYNTNGKPDSSFNGTGQVVRLVWAG
jgi:uncharacterized delta-60 repeat protein